MTTPPAGAPDSLTPEGQTAEELSTRQRVLSLILANGPSTAADLGDQLGLTSAAIRRHLTSLLDAGSITSREQRVYGQRGRGRPAKVFLLTDAGRASFPQEYDALATDAIRQLVALAGPAALGELARQRVRDVEAAYHAQRRLNPDADPVSALAGALNDAGYVTSVEPLASGQQLCQHHCPVGSVAAEFPQLCAAETQLFSQLLNTHVQRLATIAHGDGVCTTFVPHAPASERRDNRAGAS